MQVLVIENNEQSFRLFNHYFEHHKAVKTEWQDTIAKGLAYLKTNRVDVFVLDMTGLNEDTLIQLDVIQTQFPSLPIIVVNGDDSDVLALEAIRLGAQDYLPKGTFDGPSLIRSLGYALERKRREDRLRPNESLQGEEQFRSAFTYAAIGMALVGLDGRWLQVNRALCDIIGYEEQELLVTTFQDITHPDDLDTDLNYVLQVLAGDIETYQMEKRYFHKQGHQVWVLLSVSLVRTSDGQPLHFISQIQDITQRKQAEAALAKERNLLRTLIDSIPDYIYLKDTQSRFVIANKAILSSGNIIDSSQVIGKTDFDFFPAALAQTFYDDEQRLMKTGEPLINKEEVSIDLETGEERWSSTTKMALRDENGTITGLLGISWNITERKRTEALLQARMQQERELQNKLKALHEITIELTNTPTVDEFYKRSVELGLQRLGFDRLGLLLYDSKSSMAIGTYGTDAFGNMIDEHHLRFDPSELTSILFRTLYKDERFIVDENAELYSNLKPIGRGWNATAVLWNGTEKLGWLAIDNAVNHQPIDQTQLSILALYAVTLGTLMAHKQAQELLTQDRDLLRTLIDSSPDYIFIKDAAGYFTVSNIAHARAAGLTPNELVGKTGREVFPSELAEQFEVDDEQVIQTGEPMINVERTTIDQHGNTKIVLTTKIPLRDKDGRVMSLVGISRDISERKRFEAQSIELEAERERIRVLQQFMNDMSHDFRTPLSIINSSLYLMQKSTDPQKQGAYAHRAEQQVMRLDKLLEELLLMERLEEDMSVQFSVTDINSFLAPIMREYESVITAKQITAEFIPDADSCLAQIDTVEIARVITKLMDNAIMYTPEGGQITVRTKTASDKVIISIQDTGIGIAESDLPHIFERFYRADQARSASTGGSGVGLSIVQKIVEAHKGSIEVESTPGQGSRFSIMLPINSADTASE